MLCVQLLQQKLYIQLLAEACVELIDADLDLGPQLFESRDPVQELQADLLLRGFRQLRSLFHRQPKCARHEKTLAELASARHRRALRSPPPSGRRPFIAEPAAAYRMKRLK